MIANYHTHTTRCLHAYDADEAYVQSAIQGGLKILGFSDHAPQWFPGEYYSTMRMRREELDDYVRSITDLAKQYADQIEIHLGVEAEYYPVCFPRLVEELKDHGVEYIILGQHWLGNEEGEENCTNPTADESKLQRYCDQVISAMDTGYFTYLAHPDIFRFEGTDAVYESHIRRLCRAANANRVLLEINLLGIRGKRHYPAERFWRIAAEENCKVILGSDAHAAYTVCHTESEQVALELVRRLGLDLKQTVSLRNIHGV